MVESQDTTKNDSVPDSLAINARMNESRMDFTRIFAVAVSASTVVVICMGCVMVYIASVKSEDSFDRIVILRVMQIAFGNFFGSVCVYLGVVLSWFGVKESVRVAAEGHWKIMLNTTSPGIILMMGGMLLIGMAMLCKIEITERKPPPPQGSNTVVGGVGSPPVDDGRTDATRDTTDTEATERKAK